MDLIPAIDVQGGRCVRLRRGDFSTATIYETDPLLQAGRFARAGAKWLHVVDLDGAQDPKCRQFDLIAAMARQTPLKLQLGGGIRESSTIKELLDCGVERVIVGTLAAENPRLVKHWLERFTPDRIVLALDVRLGADGEPLVFTRGWQRDSTKYLWELLHAYDDSGVRMVLCTDIGRDGMLCGPNCRLYRLILERWPALEILASGGVGSLNDLFELAGAGAAGAVIGKALYEGRVDLAEAIGRMKDAC